MCLNIEIIIKHYHYTIFHNKIVSFCDYKVTGYKLSRKAQVLVSSRHSYLAFFKPKIALSLAKISVGQLTYWKILDLDNSHFLCFIYIIMVTVIDSWIANLFKPKRSCHSSKIKQSRQTKQNLIKFSYQNERAQLLTQSSESLLFCASLTSTWLRSSNNGLRSAQKRSKKLINLLLIIMLMKIDAILDIPKYTLSQNMFR